MCAPSATSVTRRLWRRCWGLPQSGCLATCGRWGAIEVELSDAKADDGARNLKALERKVLSNPAAQNAAPAFLAVVVGKGGIAYTRDDSVAVISMAALGA